VGNKAGDNSLLSLSQMHQKTFFRYIKINAVGIGSSFSTFPTRELVVYCKDHQVVCFCVWRKKNGRRVVHRLRPLWDSSALFIKRYIGCERSRPALSQFPSPTWESEREKRDSPRCSFTSVRSLCEPNNTNPCEMRSALLFLVAFVAALAGEFITFSSLGAWHFAVRVISIKVRMKGVGVKHVTFYSNNTTNRETVPGKNYDTDTPPIIIVSASRFCIFIYLL